MSDSFQCISVDKAAELLRQEPVTVVDIRDPQSFSAGHIPGAVRLDNSNVEDFLRQADPDQPVLVCCYHGHSSQGAAQFLVQRGFEQVYSLDGGMSAWMLSQPVTREDQA
jgi:thiosulfate sulfurtransferase